MGSVPLFYVSGEFVKAWRVPRRVKWNVLCGVSRIFFGGCSISDFGQLLEGTTSGPVFGFLLFSRIGSLFPQWISAARGSPLLLIARCYFECN